MFKQILKEAIEKITEDNRLIRLTFIMSFFHFMSIMYLIVWNVNNLLTYRYESGIPMGKAFEYIFLRSQANNMTIPIIVFVILCFVGYGILYPIGASAVIHYLNKGENKIGKAIGKGTNDFFVMFEYEALASTLGYFMFMITVARLFMLDILNSGLIITLIIIRGVVVFFASILWAYTKFIIVLENKQVYPAIKRSVFLSFMHFGKTIKSVFIQMFLTVRFLVNAIVIIGVPFLIVYIAILLNIIESSFIQYFIIITVVVLLILMAYINAIVEAFFATYRYKVYQEILSEEKKEEK